MREPGIRKAKSIGFGLVHRRSSRMFKNVDRTGLRAPTQTDLAKRSSDEMSPVRTAAPNGRQLGRQQSQVMTGGRGSRVPDATAATHPNEAPILECRRTGLARVIGHDPTRASIRDPPGHFELSLIQSLLCHGRQHFSDHRFGDHAKAQKRRSWWRTHRPREARTYLDGALFSDVEASSTDTLDVDQSGATQSPGGV